jgi:hypothetical protein
MYPVLHWHAYDQPQGRLSYDGPVVTGWGTIARTEGSCESSSPPTAPPAAADCPRRTLAATDHLAVAMLADVVAGWRDRVDTLLPEARTNRDLPDLTGQRCRRNRIPEQQTDGRRLLLPALR